MQKSQDLRFIITSHLSTKHRDESIKKTTSLIQLFSQEVHSILALTHEIIPWREYLLFSQIINQKELSHA